MKTPRWVARTEFARSAGFSCEVPRRPAATRDDKLRIQRARKTARRAAPLTQKTREIFVFPASRTPIARERSLPPIKFLGVNSSPTGRVDFLGHDRVQHLVIKDVLEKPARHERLIKQRMNPNHPVFFLDRAENEILPRPLFAASSPYDPITAEASAKMSFVHSLENLAQIKVATFVTKIELPLHRQHRSGQFSFCFFLRHRACFFEEKRTTSLRFTPQADKVKRQPGRDILDISHSNRGK